ncbi:hypothetical protein ACMD2_15857 [Ananas comosus]|uniref:Uncharacterized protein n=1 Tax=Ananas comosus TaxID=4615 RepID=A0A199UEZ6_ANACO|nr:hypothetical protein ACMD2_15857 [Ananas comosus]
MFGIVVVPCRCLLCADVEAVIVEADSNGFHPREVSGHVGVAPADKVGVDVEVGIGQQAKVRVLATMEVEGVAISTG